jgi:TolB-like protein
VEAGALIYELKRRRVIRAVIGYGVVAFAVLQIVEPVMHGLHWPDAVLSYVVVALAVGFPVVAALAWIFDVKQGRVERAAPVARGLTGTRLAAVLVGIGLIAAAPGVVWYFAVRGIARRSPEGPTASAAAQASIAVLPFADMSPGGDQAYFSDGIAEQILDNLAQVDGLKVIGRTSSFSFKGRNDDLRTIGEKLGVAHVLEGSVRKEGNHVRITAQLIAAADGSHLWSSSFDREMTGVFALEDEIGREVVDALKLKLAPAKAAARSETRTDNPEAYRHFLLGRHFHDRVSAEGIALGAKEYRAAIAADPGYAVAHAWLSTALCDQVDIARTAAEVTALRRGAIEAADRAVALGPDLPVALSARTLVRTKLAWDWDGAMNDVRRALAINPADPPSLRRSAILLASLGRFDDAVTRLHRSIDIDPLLSTSWNWLSYVQTAAGRLDLARTAVNRAIEIAPTSRDAQFQILLLSLVQRDPGRVATELQTLPDENDRLWMEAVVRHELDQPHEAQGAVDQLIARAGDVHPTNIAEVFALRADRDHAFQWLERALVQREPALHAVKVDPAFNSIRDDPRYVALLKKMNLPLN